MSQKPTKTSDRDQTSDVGRRPWIAEIEVSAEQARLLISEQMPEMAPVRVELFSAGWDNTVFAVNGVWLVRFPRRRKAVAHLETEIRLLPAIVDRLPLPIPAPTLVGRGSASYPWPFAGYRSLSGKTVCETHLDDRQRGRMAGSLARFFLALHAIEADDARAHGAAPDLPHYEMYLRGALDVLERLVENGVLDSDQPWRKIVEATPRHWRPESSTLVHGDVEARHVLVDERGRPTAVLDWGNVHLGDPAIDLMSAYGLLPPSARERFFAVYGDVSKERHAVARTFAVSLALMMLDYGHDIGDVALAREMRTALGFSAL